MAVYWGVHATIDAGASPTMLVVGDSWYWYPVSNLATEISEAMQPDQTLTCIGFSGSEAAQWSTRYRKDIDFGFKMFGADVQALLLSGGGNDVAGMADFLRLLGDDCSQARTVEECFRAGQPDAILSSIMGAYKEVILRFRGYNPTATVVMHNYDYAWPTGKGLFGPSDWLKAPMEKAGVPEGLRRALFRHIVDRLHEEQAELATIAKLGPLVAIKTSGTLPEHTRCWANELHPTREGFRMIATKAIVPTLRRIMETALI